MEIRDIFDKIQSSFQKQVASKLRKKNIEAFKTSAIFPLFAHQLRGNRFHSSKQRQSETLDLNYSLNTP